MDIPTARTSLRRRIPAVNAKDDLTLNVGNMLEDAHKLGTCQITYLASPKRVHSLHGQVFKEEMIVGIGQFVGKFEEPVTALIDDCLIDTRDNHLGFFPTAREFNFAGKVLLGDLQFSHGLTKVQRTFNIISNIGDQESFQTKVKPDAVTRSELIVLGAFFLYHEVQIEIAKTVTLDGDSLDVCWNVARLAELVDRSLNLDFIAVQQLPTRLLEREATILLDFLKAWGRGLNLVLEIAKEELIPLVDTLNNVLNRLTTHQIPVRIAGKLFQLGDVLHQDELVQALASQLIVAAVQRNAMIVDQSCNVDLLVQQPILFLAIQLELVGLDDSHFTPSRSAFSRIAISIIAAFDTPCRSANFVNRSSARSVNRRDVGFARLGFLSIM